MHEVAQHKAEVATAIAGSGTALTWMEHANMALDIATGVVALVSGILAAVWWIRKLRAQRKEDNK